MVIGAKTAEGESLISKMETWNGKRSGQGREGGTLYNVLVHDSRGSMIIKDGQKTF